jgi:5-formyltetrahydrofolate cyclo-ligase
MTKQELRKLYKQKRLALTATERLKLDDLILIQLQRLSLHNDISTILSFWPIEKHAEVNTLLLTRYFEVSIPNVRVAFPVIDLVTNEMQAIEVHEETDFVENNLGIPEPEEGDEIAPEDLDVVFVPLLAYDEKGNRVGYGKGFYDRFLSRCKADVITIGFSYFDAEQQINDTDRFDVPLNYCITPDKIYEF